MEPIGELARRLNPFLPKVIDRDYRMGLNAIMRAISDENMAPIIQGYTQDSLKLSRHLTKRPFVVGQTPKQSNISGRVEGILEAMIYLGWEDDRKATIFPRYEVMGEMTPYLVSFEIIARNETGEVAMDRTNGTIYQGLPTFENPKNPLGRYVGEIIELDGGKHKHGGVLVLEPLIEIRGASLNTSPSYEENENRQ